MWDTNFLHIASFSTIITTKNTDMETWMGLRFTGQDKEIGRSSWIYWIYFKMLPLLYKANYRRGTTVPSTESNVTLIIIEYKYPVRNNNCKKPLFKCAKPIFRHLSKQDWRVNENKTLESKTRFPKLNISLPLFTWKKSLKILHLPELTRGFICKDSSCFKMQLQGFWQSLSACVIFHSYPAVAVPFTSY